MSGVVPLFFSNWEYSSELVRFNPLFQLPTFIFGVSLGYYFLTDTSTKNGNFLTIFSILAIFLIAFFSNSIPKLVVHNSLFLPVFGTLFIGIAKGGYGSKFLSLPIMVLIGESSYALYILQFSIDLTMLFIGSGLLPQDYFDGRLGWGKASFYHYVVLLIVSITISVFIFKYFESPLRFKLRNKIIAIFIKK
jgi:peptidoglycan/LPS O-acetylase OafA/YrhL